MTEPRQAGPVLLVVGLALGLLADSTLRAFPWGLNAALCIWAMGFSLAALQSWRGLPVGRGQLPLVVAVLLIAMGLTWRDTVVLKVLDLLVLAAALGMLASEREGRAGHSLSSYLVRIVGTVAHSVLGPTLLVVCDTRWSEFRARPFLGGALGLLRGLALAVPLLIVFTVLLASADAVFALQVRELLDIDVWILLGHASVTLILGWLAAGLLRAGVLRERPVDEAPPRPGWLAIGGVEIAVALGLLNVLFLAFVSVQFRYLFGGASWVRQVAGLTYAEYARRGFFELVTVAALVLGLLLAAHWLLDANDHGRRRLFAGLAVTQVLLVLVMLASALERMRLYRAEYGLTELRFYTTAFMLWLGGLLVWFACTVVRGRRDVFAQGAVGSALVALVLLHAVNPDEQIVLANAEGRRSFDAAYAGPERRCRSGAAFDSSLARRWKALRHRPEPARTLVHVRGGRLACLEPGPRPGATSG